MLILRFKAPTIHLTLPLSQRILIKHLPALKFKAYRPRRTSSRTLSTTAVLNSSQFETLNSSQQERIRVYVDALLDWNQRMNLTAVKEVNEVMERHIEDSLALISPLHQSYTSHCNDPCDNLNVVDVGTGAGLPGLVLAIARPGWNVTLLESMNKRCVFLEHAVTVTGLSNVQVVRGRAETMLDNDDLNSREYLNSGGEVEA